MLQNNLYVLKFSAPNPPVLLSGTTIDSQSVRVQWRAPTQLNGIITNYTITYTANDKTNRATVSYEGNVS